MNFLLIYLIGALAFGSFVGLHAARLQKRDLELIAISEGMPLWIADAKVLGALCGITWPISLPAYLVVR